MNSKDIFINILKNYDDDLSYESLSLVCKMYYSVLKDINQMVLIVIPKEWYNIYTTYERQLMFSKSAPNVQTVKTLISDEMVSSRYMDLFKKTYETKKWKNMRPITLDDIKSERNGVSYLFTSIALISGQEAFSYMYRFLSESGIKFKFDDSLFDHICGNERMSKRFILWILRKRPNSIIITSSGIEKLIERNFDYTIIRDIVINPSKYNITSCYCEYERRLCMIDGSNVNDFMVGMAWKAYLDKILFGFNLEKANYNELSFYHRIIKDMDQVRAMLLWALNGGRSDAISHIMQIIHDNIDVKPYSMFYCYSNYKAPFPFKFIEPN